MLVVGGLWEGGEGGEVGKGVPGRGGGARVVSQSVLWVGVGKKGPGTTFVGSGCAGRRSLVPGDAAPVFLDSRPKHECARLCSDGSLAGITPPRRVPPEVPCSAWPGWFRRGGGLWPPARGILVQNQPLETHPALPGRPGAAPGGPWPPMRLTSSQGDVISSVRYLLLFQLQRRRFNFTVAYTCNHPHHTPSQPSRAQPHTRARA